MNFIWCCIVTPSDCRSVKFFILTTLDSHEQTFYQILSNHTNLRFVFAIFNFLMHCEYFTTFYPSSTQFCFLEFFLSFHSWVYLVLWLVMLMNSSYLLTYLQPKLSLSSEQVWNYWIAEHQSWNWPNLYYFAS